MAAIVIDSPRWREGWGDGTATQWGDGTAARPSSTPAPRPALRLVDSGDRRPAARHLRRRRFVAVLALLVVLAVALAVASSLLTRPARAGSLPEGRQTHVVQPGETYWSIADATTDDGDLRIAVDALIDANGGRPLLAGDVVELP